MRRLVRGERGTAVPAFLVIVLATGILGVLGFQVSRATGLSAEAQTGADAAALAAAADLREQVHAWVLTGGWNERAFTPDIPRATRAARDYARDNDTDLESLQIRATGYLRFEVDVTTVTLDRLGGQGGPAPTTSHPPTPATTPTPARGLPGAGRPARQSATARIAPGPASLFGGAGWWRPAGALPPDVADDSGSCPIGDDELRRLAEAAGLDPEFGVTGHGSASVLNRYTRCDGPGVALAPMPDVMKIALLRLEAAMREPLFLASGYRSPGYQAQLCLRVSGPCAAPGRSMHNIGLAVDVVNHQAAARAANADPTIGLCQPLPADDAVHLSHVSGRECGGRTGTAGAGSFLPFGGAAGLAAQADLVIALVR